MMGPGALVWRRAARWLGVLGANLVGIALVYQWLSAPPPYQVVVDWPRLPPTVTLGQVAGVGVDTQGDVYVFRRAGRPWQGEPLDPQATLDAPAVLVLEAATGALKAEWGAGVFVMPHSLTVDSDDHIWVTDVGRHQVLKFDRAGQLLMALGERGVPGADAGHFNLPTDVAVAADGVIYVSDGYANSRIVRFSPEGRYLGEWGRPGAGPGEFATPHSVAVDAAGRVLVADRGNARLQVFSAEGQWLATWAGPALGRPWAVRVDAAGQVYVVDGGDQPALFPDRARLLKFTSDGRPLAAVGAYGRAPGQFIWPHALALGPDGAVYVGEVASGQRVQKFLP